jgi:hypothetical protein
MAFKNRMAAILVLAVSAHAQIANAMRPTTQSEIREAFEQGDKLWSAKDYVRAGDQFEAAQKKIDTLDDGKLKTTLALEAAVRYARVAAKSSRLDLVERAYQRLQGLVGRTEGLEKARAQVQLADLALIRNQPRAAVDLLRGCDWKQFDRSQQPRLRYNLGRAYELIEHDDDAFIQYRDAAILDPTFDRAAERAVKAAWLIICNNPPEKRVSPARGLAASLAKAGLARQTSAFAAHQLTRNELTESEVDAATALLVMAWASTYRGPVDFLKSEKANFDKFAIRVDGGQGASALKTLMLDELRVNRENPWSLPEPLKWCALQHPELRKVYAQFAMAVGNWWLAPSNPDPEVVTGGLHPRPFQEQSQLIPKPQPEQALACCLIAWSLDRDWETAMACARVLSQSGDSIDPKIATELVQQVFHREGDLYALPVNSADDRRSLLGLHSFLGLYFEQHKRWGNEDEIASAVFQWNHAIAVYEHLIRDNAAKGPAPGLNQHLARCLMGAKQNQSAFRQCLLAADGYLETNDPVPAANSIQTARNLDIQPTASDLKHLRAIEARLEQFKK